MKGTLGLKKGSVPFKNGLETTLNCSLRYTQGNIAVFGCVGILLGTS